MSGPQDRESIATRGRCNPCSRTAPDGAVSPGFEEGQLSDSVLMRGEIVALPIGRNFTPKMQHTEARPAGSQSARSPTEEAGQL